MYNVMAEPNSIELHSAQASYYKYRTPYVSSLFEVICREIGVTRNSVLMDLGCGRGEVASALSNYSDRIYAVDGSREMIAQAIKKNQIDYQVVDLNTSSPSVGERVSHLFFGRSIHWFPPDSLLRLSSDLLADGGSIVVCSAQWTPVGDWGRCYFEVKRKFVSEIQESKLDFTGRMNLGEVGFFPIKNVSAEARATASVEYVIGHAYSTAYRNDLKELRLHSRRFEREMRKSLAPFEESGQIIMKVSSWALIYAKKG